MKIIFLGTPDFAKNVLQGLIDSKHQVVAVVCQPDKPVGRKQILTEPPVKKLAVQHNIPVFQFDKIRKQGVLPLRELNADVMVTAAYGQILSKEILNITKYGVINVHGSLLPKYRGSSPIQWCLINGENKTGVTIMKTDEGMDTGDIILKQEVEIMQEDNVLSLYDKLSMVGTKLLLEALDKIENGTAVFEKQNEQESSYYPMLKKEDGKIDFNKNARDIVNLIKGLEEWPTAFCYLNGDMLKIYKAKSLTVDEFLNVMEPSNVSYLIYNSAKNGEVLLSSPKKGIYVKCKDSVLMLLEMQLQGGKKLVAKDFANGNRLKQGIILNNVPKMMSLANINGEK